MRVIVIIVAMFAAGLGCLAQLQATRARDGLEQIAELQRLLLEARMNASSAAARAATAESALAARAAAADKAAQDGPARATGPAIANDAADQGGSAAMSSVNSDIQRQVQQQLREQIQQQLRHMPSIETQKRWGSETDLTDTATVKSQLNVDDQKAEATARIVTELRSSMAALFEQDPHHQASVAKVRELRAAAQAKLASVLSPGELTLAMHILDLPTVYRLSSMDPQPAAAATPQGTMH